MATPTKAIHRLRRARRREAPPKTTEFDRYRPQYRAVLTAMRDVGGDPAIDELTDWIEERIHETGHLPTPEVVRRRARTIADVHGLDVPEDSPIRSDDSRRR